jgi:hypothetical protein
MEHWDRFKQSMAMLGEVYDKEITPAKLKIYWQLLKQYPIDSIENAVLAHISQPNSAFFPKPGELIKHIQGDEITGDMIIAAARLCETPLGCLARIKIGQWDLENQDAFYLRQRAAECLQLLPEWKAKAAAGEYTDHEISVMLKYDISPAAPFFAGLAAPANANALLSRVKAISKSERHLKFIEPPHDASDTDKKAAAHPDVQKHIALLAQEVSISEESDT